MSLVTVPMYRAECEAVVEAGTCRRSPQDDGEYAAWAEPDTALDEARDADYYVTGDTPGGTVVVLCPEHAPRCADADCTARLRSDEDGDRCEDHAPEERGA